MGSGPQAPPLSEPSVGLGVPFKQLLSICHTHAGRALEPLLDAEVHLGGLPHLFGFTLPCASPSRV
jgi:hypothetical protein